MIIVDSTDIIEMIPFNKDYVIPEDGKYLVKTESTGPLKTIHYLQATCTKVFIEKKKQFETSIDVHNQIVLQISKEPLKF